MTGHARACTRNEYVNGVHHVPTRRFDLVLLDQERTTDLAHADCRKGLVEDVSTWRDVGDRGWQTGTVPCRGATSRRPWWASLAMRPTAVL